MKALLYFSLLVICNIEAYSTSYSYAGNHNQQTDFPTDVDLPPILHKYEFDDPDVVFKPRERSDDDNETEEDIDYETFEQNAADLREFQRELPSRYFNSAAEQSNVSPVQNDNVCTTAACRKAASEIKNNMNTNIDPCEDFDKFACGGWRKQNTIPKTHSQWSVFMKLWQDEEVVLRNLIERQADSSVNSSASLVYSWYSSCMDQKEIKRLGATPLLELINKLGSCPLLDPLWFPFGWSFVDHLVALNRIGIFPFIQVLPTTDLLNSSRVLLQVSPSDLLLRSPLIYLKPGKYYKSVRHAYFILMAKLMLKLSPKFVDPFKFKYGILGLFKMEQGLAATRLHKKKGKQPKIYQKMTLRRLQQEIPEFPWKLYLRKLYYKIPQKKPMTDDEIIGVRHLWMVKKIFRLLKFTPKSLAANYLIWHIVYRFSFDLGHDFDAILDEFVNAMYGKRVRKPRWRECVSSTSSALGVGVGKLFVEEKFNEEMKEKAVEIIEDIRHQLIKDFDEITWMDNETTTKAKEKANAMVKNIGYPKFILNETLVRYYFSGMSFNPRRFLKNILQRRMVVMRNTLVSREKKPNRGRWSMSPQQINAYYSGNFNKIVFPAGILQPPFWQANVPMALQYGGFGFIAGHEITHGFDSGGVHYDKHGNYRGWATESSMKAFMSKARCLQDQYSQYKIFGKNINGNLTLGENIADNGGLRLAYKAYKAWVEKNGQEKRLPDLPYNGKQLFFLKAAQIWCSNLRRRATLNAIATDPHTPKVFRTIGSFSNCVEFSRAFNCPVGSRMNPKHKCSVW